MVWDGLTYMFDSWMTSWSERDFTFLVFGLMSTGVMAIDCPQVAGKFQLLHMWQESFSGMKEDKHFSGLLLLQLLFGGYIKQPLFKFCWTLIGYIKD